MADYAAPLADMRFVLDKVVGYDRITGLPDADAVTPDLVDQVLTEAGRLAGEVLAPLNASGDRQGAHYENGAVRAADGFTAAYRQYVDGGWNGVPFDPEYDGQGLPWAIAFPIQEMWQAANMAFALCPLLNQGAVELLSEHGSDAQKERYLRRLISGEWTGTMDLTEPQAGSDLAAVRCRAEPDGDHYRIFGQKIYITWGEHDLTENIIHMVLARLPDAPPGVKGISLFIVPKFLVEPDGRLGARNDLRCTGIEHKLGINASPTAVLAYGESDGAIGYLVGEANRGLSYMFTMMNNARLSVGLQGIAIAERAYQQARAYAAERIQSKDLTDPKGPSVPILRHPDVRRMLLTMKAGTEAMRALAYEAGLMLDLAKRAPEPARAAAAQARVDLLTPVVKAWSTDLGVELASIGIQVHGGMGYVEETGAAQHWRDARIAPIYEGTNGIQANDLVFRKVARDDGAAAGVYLDELRGLVARLAERPGDDLAAIKGALDGATAALDRATKWVVATAKGEPAAVAASAVPYLALFGTVAGGAMMARAALAALDALAAPGADATFLEAKVISARFYAEHYLPRAEGLATTVVDGWRTVVAVADDQL